MLFVDFSGEKPFSCSFCEVAYAQKNDLVKHLRIHVGENTYMCDNCDMKFRYYLDWRKHRAKCEANSKSMVEDDNNKIPETPTYEMECN